MNVLADFPLSTVISTGGALVLAVLGLVGYIMRGIFKYLIDRIGVLEGRQATLLESAVASLNQQGQELAAQGALVAKLAKTDEQREWARGKEGG